MSQAIYEARFLGIRVTVYPDRVEYKPGLLSGTQSIPIVQIASIQHAPLTNKLTIETSGGRQFVLITTKKREVEQAIYHAQAMLRSPRVAAGQAWVPTVPAPGVGARLRRWLLIVGGVCIALMVIGAMSSPKSKSGGAASGESCDGRADRETWIGASNPSIEGYSPSTFHMSATGACSATLRVREKDCSLRYLLEAYGRKPFMKEARDLGFRKLSCGYDEFELSSIVGP